MSDSTNFQQQQNRAQRRLLFEGFNLQDTNGGVKFVPTRHPKTNLRHSPDLIADRIYTSTPEKKSELNNDEQSSTRFIISENSTHIPQTQQSCIIQLQNAKNLLQSMSRSNINSYEQQQQQTSSNNDNSNNIDNQLRNNGEYIKGDYDFHGNF
ncbi:unnamed protein product [Didymodactylos carnosus]|uniref:Uncharacterized protein n=1 Tax=Didymodactylos carnosus TaxID=1234261 RepID=A0A815R8V6_9BILA|nr:unnamed protein product [Didymodactylos carnosus]CAF1529455.1 unnamed protein product [Didymodactylos carnosus]CAF4316195.1 unnamed protein product [Didymodactylos carnosus]CAF4340587.1 unnamed protein product [Didymodactylos carnosus]